MLVSTIIPCYNGALFLREAIESALAQTYPHQEVLVVDDGSTDGSAEVAASFGDRVRLLRNSRNMERSWSRNRAIAESKGDLIAFLDADDVWLPHKLSRQVLVFQRDPSVGLIYGKAQEFRDDQGRRTTGSVVGASLGADAPLRNLVRDNVIPALTAVLRKDVVKAVGGFDTTPWVQGCEDYDLWLRVTNVFVVLFTDEVLALYRVHANQTSANAQRMVATTCRLRRRFVARHPAVLGGVSDREAWRLLYAGFEQPMYEALRDREFGDACGWWFRILCYRQTRFLARRVLLGLPIIRRLCKVAMLAARGELTTTRRCG